MGGSSSTAAATATDLTLLDVVRAREWLLIDLQNRYRIEQNGEVGSMQLHLLQAFERFDVTAKGTVPLEAAFVIAHDLALDIKWTHEQIERFLGLFKRLEKDDDADADNLSFSYRLFLSFLFFPIEQEPSKLRIKESVSSSAGRFAVHPSEFVLGAFTLINESDASERGVPATTKKLVLAARSSDDDDDDDAITELREEVNNLRLFSHPNVTRYYATLRSRNALYLVEESHPSCSLMTILKSFGAMKEPTIRRYLLQMLQALQYLHERDISHGSLSTQTVSIDSYGLLKLCEFGIGKQLKKLLSQPGLPQGDEEQEWTIKFPSPESSRDHGGVGGKKSDIWSVGILVLQMANGFKRDSIGDPLSPLPSSRYGQPKSSPQKRSATLPRTASPQKKLESESIVLPTLPHTASKSLRTLVRACLQPNPRKRATAEQLTTLDFFQVDAAQATNEMLRTVCTDLDASMRRLISSSSSGHSPSERHRSSGSGNSNSIRTVPARSGSAFASSPVYTAAHTKARASSAARNNSKW